MHNKWNTCAAGNLPNLIKMLLPSRSGTIQNVADVVIKLLFFLIKNVIEHYGQRQKITDTQTILMLIW